MAWLEVEAQSLSQSERRRLLKRTRFYADHNVDRVGHPMRSPGLQKVSTMSSDESVNHVSGPYR